jgi:hypothetical protein
VVGAVCVVFAAGDWVVAGAVVVAGAGVEQPATVIKTMRIVIASAIAYFAFNKTSFSFTIPLNIFRKNYHTKGGPRLKGGLRFRGKVTPEKKDCGSLKA